MSFLKQLRDSKNSLRNVTTTVKHPDGRQFLENRHYNVEIQRTVGFVVDTRPDNVPAEIVKNVYLGSQDCCESDVLNKFDIEFVLSIGVEPLLLRQNVVRKFVKCLDIPETNIIDILYSECFDFIQIAISQNKNILVHCNAGVSRSSSIIIGFLMITYKLSYAEAFNIVKSKRPCIKPNSGFVTQLKSLEV